MCWGYIRHVKGGGRCVGVTSGNVDINHLQSAIYTANHTSLLSIASWLTPSCGFLSDFKQLTSKSQGKVIIICLQGTDIFSPFLEVFFINSSNLWNLQFLKSCFEEPVAWLYVSNLHNYYCFAFIAYTTSVNLQNQK